MTKTQKTVYYIVTTITSLMFLFSAYSKLSGDPMATAGFATAHLPLWFMYFIGAAEVLGGIALWIPKLQKWAVYGLSIIMIGAIIVTAIFVSVPMAIIPLVFFVFLVTILKLGKKRGAAPTNIQNVPATPVQTL